MVVGNGLIASSFLDYKDDDRYLIFASGVSSSSNILEKEFLKEKDLISRYYGTKSKFIYFSSTLIDKESAYFRHKREMEKIVSENMESYIIFRLPNIIGFGGNSRNIFNFFKESIENGKSLEIIKSTRSLVDVEDLKKICEYCLSERNCTLTLSTIERMSVFEMANMIADEIGIPANINLTNEEEIIDIENSFLIEEAISTIGIDKKGYTKKIIKKYI